MVPHPSDPSAQVVVQQGGLVRVLRNGVVQPQAFLDLSAVISSGGERGLLGLAFAPDYVSSRRLFVNFTNTSGHTVVARFTTMVSDPLRADPASRFDLRWGGATGQRFITQPFSNHNGGHLAFGGDGYLYIGMGDGGSGGDPGNRAQDPNTLLGKMLRINTNVADTHSEGYVVPSDNPFVAGGGLPEIWSFGLRNPWKFTFDSSGAGGAGTAAMIMGDVGQGAREEINYEPAGRGGRNYGWRLREGLLPYLPNTTPAYLPLTDPMFDYPRTEGQSVTGGYVYRGRALRSGFRGRYFYADFVSGRVWSLGLTLNASGEATVLDRVEHTAELGGAALGNIAAFGTDVDGELYLLSFNGSIFRIAHNPDATGPIGGVPGGGTSARPFGTVDSPVQDATGVVGAVGVTGWALDDGGVTGVQVYRTCFSFDQPVNCQSIQGHSVVFLGDATFVEGARPDVEAAYPGYPGARTAGWGLLVLTNGLPHVPNQAPFGGQGTLAFYAFARDNDQQLTLLGRSEVDHTPTTITMANDTIAKPFGSLDTPTQGGTVSGTFASFGWALTPDLNTTADASDILVPVTGATVRLFIDGAFVGTVAYSQCRGTVGNPVPPAAYCDDDVASAFGHLSPQPNFTPRSSNPTRFRNLDAGRGAVGAYVVNSTTLTNGRHTIGWSVEDSSGRAEGIGSRFFTVANGADTPSELRRSAEPSIDRIADAPPSPADVMARTGFSVSAPWQHLRADGEGLRHVRLPDMGRLELAFHAAPEQAYLMANGSLRALPVGAALNGRHFTWATGPGHRGTYALVFVIGGQRTDVRVSVTSTSTTDGSALRMTLDDVRVAEVARRIRAGGWALDREGAFGSGVGAVHVWATSATGQVFLGAATLEGERPDVAAAFGPAGTHAGFTLDSTVVLRPGTYTVTAYVWLERTQRWEDARSQIVTIR